MKRFLFSLIPCLALGLIIGCGGGGGETSVVETEVSSDDQAAAEESAAEYDSDEYARAMAEQQKPGN